MAGVLKWKNIDVLNYLRTNKLESLCATFKEHNINGKDLLSLTTDELRMDMGIRSVHIRKKLQRKIGKLKQTSTESIVVKVLYFSKEAKFRVTNPEIYTVKDLLEDCIQCYQLKDEPSLLFKDASEHILPFNSTIESIAKGENKEIEMFLIRNDALTVKKVQEEHFESIDSKEMDGRNAVRKGSNEHPHYYKTEEVKVYPMILDKENYGHSSKLSPERQRQLEISRETEELLTNYRRRIQTVKEKLRGKDSGFSFSDLKFAPTQEFHLQRGGKFQKTQALSRDGLLEKPSIMDSPKTPHEWLP